MIILQKPWRKLVFWAGDVRRLGKFPYVTWDVKEHLIDFDEASRALPLVQAGDIGLHRDAGYLSNLAIPGFFKHAWIHTSGVVTTPAGHPSQIVEAISDGVLQRHAFNPLHTDYAIILRPKFMMPEDIDHAVEKALKVVGNRYDDRFEFDVEAELNKFGFAKTRAMLRPEEKAKVIVADRKDLELHTENLTPTSDGWDGGFSCTELVSFAWWHKREQLRLFRTQHRGRQVILADSMMNHSYEIVWKSKSVTADVAKKMGLHEEGCSMISGLK